MKMFLATTALVVLATSASAQTPAVTPAGVPVVVNKAPASKLECLKLLRGFAAQVDEGKASAKAVAEARPMGRAMGTYCNAERFADAFEMYKKIVATLNKK